jgi:signal transduction histidine kinase
MKLIKDKNNFIFLIVLLLGAIALGIQFNKNNLKKSTANNDSIVSLNESSKKIDLQRDNPQTPLDNSIIYKDFNQIDLEDLNNEGEVGALLMRGHEATSLDSTLYYVQKSLARSEQIKDSLLRPYILYHLGYTNFNLQNFSKAKIYLKKCLIISNPYKLNGMLYECNNLLGLIEKYNNNFDLSLKYFQKAIKSTNNEADKIRIKINLITIYLDTEKYEFAKLLLNEVLKFEKDNPGEIGDYWLAFAYMNGSYLQESFENELKMMQKAKYHAEISEDNVLIIQTKLNLADVLLDNNNDVEGIKELKGVILKSKEFKMFDVLNRSYFLLSVYYNKEGFYKKSLQVLDSIQLTNNVIWLNKKIIELKYDNYKNEGDFKNALLCSDSIINYLKEVNEIEKQEASMEYAKKYETEKKIQENKLLKQEAEIQNLKIKKEENKVYISLAIIIIIIILFAFVYNQYRNKKKISEILTKKNNLIKIKNENLKTANETKQKLFSIISHDLINPFNAILGYTNLLETDYDTFNDAEKKEFISTINKYATYNYNLTKNLLEWSRTQQNRITIKKEQLNLKNIVLEIVNALEPLSNIKNIETIIQIEDALVTHADKNGLKTIINNLYSNAIKFSFANSSIVISAKKQANKTIVTIKDVGIGIEEEQINNLFKINKTKTTLGTIKEKGTGFGLLICKELIDLHKGEINITSKPNEGTTIVFSL